MFSNSFSHKKAEGEAVKKKLTGEITMTPGHELHVHRYAKQSRARNL